MGAARGPWVGQPRVPTSSAAEGGTQAVVAAAWVHRAAAAVAAVGTEGRRLAAETEPLAAAAKDTRFGGGLLGT